MVPFIPIQRKKSAEAGVDFRARAPLQRREVSSFQGGGDAPQRRGVFRALGDDNALCCEVGDAEQDRAKQSGERQRDSDLHREVSH